MGKDHDYGYFIVQNGKIFMKRFGQIAPTMDKTGRYFVYSCFHNGVLTAKMIPIVK